jgi:L-ribulose-5-phosphate 4-epimerase
MTLQSLREQVLEANLEVVRRGLVLYTWGNASGIDRDQGLIVIKPSGVPYENLRAADMVVTDLEGRIVEGSLRASSDLATHVELYRAFPKIGGVVHTHSRYATAWAQAAREIPCMGTTHADYFYGSVPLTEHLTPQEIDEGYERGTGHAIVRRFSGLDPLALPGVLVVGHAPFCWGKNAMGAARHAVILEEIAAIGYHAFVLNASALTLPQSVQDKHYFRKHGPDAYYGQPGSETKH